MERGRGRTRCAVGGGTALAVGTVLYALCSPSSVSCATNLVVLTHGTVTARSCAAYSVAAHIGVGLIVLGAVLLVGSFVLTVRHRRQVAVDAESVQVAAPEPIPSGPAPPVATRRRPPEDERTVRSASSEAPGAGYPAVERRRGERRRTTRQGPIPPGEGSIPPGRGPVPPGGTPIPPREDEPPEPAPVVLPPGWYGNPDNPDGPVRWWDGTRLTDRPS